MATCTRSFDEEMLSGYLDRALPQAETRKIRIHLEDCEGCRSLYNELKMLRDAARDTSFREPEENAWPELPKTRFGFLSRSFGWTLVVSWLIVVTAYALWHFFAETGDPLEIFLVLGLPGGVALLFLSVLVERVRELKNDRYRGVHR